MVPCIFNYFIIICILVRNHFLPIQPSSPLHKNLSPSHGFVKHPIRALLKTWHRPQENNKATVQFLSRTTRLYKTQRPISNPQSYYKYRSYPSTVPKPTKRPHPTANPTQKIPHPSKITAKNQKIKTEKEIISKISPFHTYRLGDIFRGFSGKEYHLEFFPNSIASQYLIKTNRSLHFSVFSSIIDDKKHEMISKMNISEKHGFPKENQLIMHLRIGDVSPLHLPLPSPLPPPSSTFFSR